MRLMWGKKIHVIHIFLVANFQSVLIKLIGPGIDLVYTVHINHTTVLQGSRDFVQGKVVSPLVTHLPRDLDAI